MSIVHVVEKDYAKIINHLNYFLSTLKIITSSETLKTKPPYSQSNAVALLGPVEILVGGSIWSYFISF